MSMDMKKMMGLAVASAAGVFALTAGASATTFTGTSTSYLGQYSYGTGNNGGLTFGPTKVATNGVSGSLPVVNFDTFSSAITDPNSTLEANGQPFSDDIFFTITDATAKNQFVQIGLASDDGSYLFVGGDGKTSGGGTKAISEGVDQVVGATQFSGPLKLDANGQLSLELQYAENGFMPGTINLSENVLPTPEPGTVASFAFGGFGLVGLALRARKSTRRAA